MGGFFDDVRALGAHELGEGQPQPGGLQPLDHAAALDLGQFDKFFLSRPAEIGRQAEEFQAQKAEHQMVYTAGCQQPLHLPTAHDGHYFQFVDFLPDNFADHGHRFIAAPAAAQGDKVSRFDHLTDIGQGSHLGCKFHS